MHPRTGPDRSPLRAEDGFALLEVMVTAVLLIVLALATLSILDQSATSSAANRSRGVASGLAQADQDHMRQAPIAQLGNLHASRTKQVDNVVYTIKSETQWARDASGIVSCSANASKAEYLKIISTVTWPNMGSVAPVVAESYVAPGVTALGTSRGALTVKLTDDASVGTAGVPVSTQGQTAVTDSAGCAVFGNLNATTSPVTWSLPNFTDRDGRPSVSKSQTVVGGSTSQLTDLYAREGSARVNIVDDSATPAGAGWTSITAFHSSMTVSQSGVAGTRTWSIPLAAKATTPSYIDADHLFPFSTNYTFLAGRCGGNDPKNYLSTFVYPAGSSVKVLPAQNAAPTVTMPKVTVTVQANLGGPVTAVAGARVVAYAEQNDPKMAGCTAAVDRTFRGDYLTDAAGKVTMPLPYGVWRVCADVPYSGSTYFVQTTGNAVATPVAASPIVNTPTSSTAPYGPQRNKTMTFTSSATQGSCA